MEYQEFLKQKGFKTVTTGFEIDMEEINPVAFPYQKDIIKWALSKGKCGIFADCGLGKTIIQGIIADAVHKKTGGKVIIVAPLGVTRQTQEEIKEKLGLESTICRKNEDVRDGINIVNYEMLSHLDTSQFICVILDESSILKNFVGKTKVQINERFKNTKYKFSLTGTPAPNDYLELLNQADFLDVMEAGKALATWFINDMKTGEWRLKGHAVGKFWEWVSTWAVIIDKPSDLGYSDKGYELPKHNEIPVEIEIDLIDKDNLEDGFVRKVEMSATSYHKEKRRTADVRARKCAEIVNQEPAEQYLVWCETNQEADLLKEHIPEAVEVRGSDKTEFKEQAAVDFKKGNIRVLISKAKIFGYGMNFQNCHNAVFCGRSFSYEDYYQAIKRLWRFGQKHEVNTYSVFGSTERRILDVVYEKQQKQLQMKHNITNCIKEIQLSNFTGKEIENRNNATEKIEIPQWLGRTNYYESYNE